MQSYRLFDIHSAWFRIWLCAVIVFCAAGCERGDTLRGDAHEQQQEQLSEERFRRIKSQIERFTNEGKFDSVILQSHPLLALAKRDNNLNRILFSAAYLSQSYVFIDNYDSAKVYLKVAEDCLEKIQRDELDPFIVGMNYNTNAIYVMKTKMDYITALDYLNRSLEMTIEHGDSLNQCILLSNIASLYHQREDATGLSYAKKAYDLGRSMKNIEFVIPNATYLAAMFYFTSNYVDALRYINEALDVAKNQPEDSPNQSLVYMTYGDIMAGSGEKTEAKTAYDKAEAALKYANESTAIKLYLSYGDFLAQEGLYSDAKAKYARGLDIATQINNVEHTHKLLWGLSSIYDQLGDRAKALEYHKRYHDAYTRVFNLGKEQEFNNLIMKYEQVKHEEEIHLKDLEYAKVKTDIVLITAVFVVVLLFSIYSYILYRKKEKMYSTMVANYTNFSKRIEEMTNAEKERNEIMNKTSKKLFDALEVLMKEQKIYRRKDLSLVMVGEMLSSNSTYVSKAINTCAGTSFLVYVNSYRMREAVALLSDPDNDTPLKAIADQAGYSNITSFYRYFEKETSCTPSKFRQEVRHLKNASERPREL